MNKQLVARIACIFAFVVIALLATSSGGSSASINRQPVDFQFGAATFLGFTITNACAGTSLPCDTVVLTAPFECVDCAEDFRNALAPGAGNAVTVGFYAPGGQCKNITHVPPLPVPPPPQERLIQVKFNELNFIKRKIPGKDTVYEGATVFPSSGENAFNSAIIDIQGEAGTLVMTGSGNFSHPFIGVSPVSVFIEETEPEQTRDKGDVVPTEVACSEVAPVYRLAPPVGSATALVSAPNPSTAGRPVTFTATLASTIPGARVPSGTVIFSDVFKNAYRLGIAATNADGLATFTTSALVPGIHTVTAAYSGNASYAVSSSHAVSQTVKALTTTTLTSSLNPSVFGQSVTLTATVTASGATGTPTGTVTFADGDTAIGTATLNSGGAATFSTTTLTPGSHSITATYAGDAAFDGSFSNAVSQTVNKIASTTALVSAPNPSTAGHPVTFTATVASTIPGARVPSGTVIFSDVFKNAYRLGIAATNADGLATFTTSALVPGIHTVTAAYSGNASYAVSSSHAVSQTVKALTTTTLTSSLNPSVFGQSVTLTATVTASGATGTPTGTVTFADGDTAIGTATLNSGGAATFSTTNLTIGSHTIVATYGGDDNFNGSDNASSPLVQVVNPPAPPKITRPRPRR